MSDEQNHSRVLRSIGAVLAGVIAVVVLSIGTDLLLHATGVFPPWGQPMNDGLFVLATGYRVAYAVLGGYIAARLAPNRPMAHALVLGVVGVVLSTIGAAATWNKGPEFGPHWYPLALVVTALPCAWAGGKLVRAQSRAPTMGTYSSSDE
jgi:multisubunit Na+/H+ antiporter MnhB subunit